MHETTAPQACYRRRNRDQTYGGALAYREGVPRRMEWVAWVIPSNALISSFFLFSSFSVNCTQGRSLEKRESASIFERVCCPFLGVYGCCDGCCAQDDLHYRAVRVALKTDYRQAMQAK
jgi:hypothetical protein